MRSRTGSGATEPLYHGSRAPDAVTPIQPTSGTTSAKRRPGRILADLGGVGLKSGTESADAIRMRRRSSAPRRLAVVVTTTVCTGLVSVPAAHGSVASDQAQIVVIQRRIAAQGAQVRSLVVRENATQSQVDSFKRQIVADEQRVAADKRHRKPLRVLVLRQLAVSAYMTRRRYQRRRLLTCSATARASRRRSSCTPMPVRSETRSPTALAALQAAREATEHDAHNLRAAKDTASHALARLRTEHGAVTAAIATEQRTLTSVKQDLRKQLQAERTTAQLATELDAREVPMADQRRPTAPDPTADARVLRQPATRDPTTHPRTHRHGRRLQRLRTHLRDR